MQCPADDWWTSNSKIRACWNSIYEMETLVPLKFGTRAKGPSFVFYAQVLNNEWREKHNYEFMMQMETDVFPVRAGWIDIIYEQCLLDNWLPFWVKGSIGYRWCPSISASPVCDEIQHYDEHRVLGAWETIFIHINGNALYNIGDSR